MAQPVIPTRWLVRSLGAALVAAFACAAPDHAMAQRRPVSATARQDLTFGTLLAGVPTAISRTDALNAGQVELRGQKDTQVLVTVTLPASLLGPGGAAVPLMFGAADGGYSQTSSIAAATVFDPRSPLLAMLSGNGRLFLYLGGTASPGPQQTPGAYGATITVTVSYTN